VGNKKTGLPVGVLIRRFYGQASLPTCLFEGWYIHFFVIFMQENFTLCYVFCRRRRLVIRRFVVSMFTGNHSRRLECEPKIPPPFCSTIFILFFIYITAYTGSTIYRAGSIIKVLFCKI
jgi:hypothetical protein